MYTVKPSSLWLGAVDWFQLSWRPEEEYIYGKAYYDKQLEQDGDGFPLRPDRRYQYRGGSSGDIFVGSCDQGGFLEARGAVANDCFQIAKNIKGGGRCSRIDIQITVQLGHCNEGIAAACCAATIQRSKKGDHKAPKKCPLQGQKGEGWTGYLGAPSSRRRGRVYDKGAQKSIAPAGHIWRFEIQERDHYARARYEQLCGLGADFRVIEAAVRGQFAAWGIDIITDGIEPIEVVVGRKDKTDDDKTLSWLREAVHPSVVRLLGGAKREEMVRLLHTWRLMAMELDSEA